MKNVPKDGTLDKQLIGSMENTDDKDIDNFELSKINILEGELTTLLNSIESLRIEKSGLFEKQMEILREENRIIGEIAIAEQRVVEIKNRIHFYKK